MSELTAKDLVAMIRQKYKTDDKSTYNQSVILEEVANGTGWHQGRWIDAVVFQLWPSKGLDRIAFEVKTSRQDLLRELNDPTKHAWCQECFHQFWFVAPKDILKTVDELPRGAGWMYPSGKRLCIGRQATRNDKPRIDDVLLAAFMRSANKSINAALGSAVKAEIEKNETYQRGVWMTEAVTRFLNSHGGTSRYYQSADDLYCLLEEATTDQQAKQDRDQLLRITGRFQQEVAGLLSTMLVLARRSLLARDELGHFIEGAYGGQDDHAIEELKKIVSDPKKKGTYDRHAGLINTLVEWEKLTVQEVLGWPR